MRFSYADICNVPFFVRLLEQYGIPPNLPSPTEKSHVPPASPCSRMMEAG